MAEIFPINREDDGQTQLQEKNGVVSAVPQPTYPAINIPDVITQDFFNRPPSADRQRIENDLQQRRQEYLASFQQTAREQQLQQESMDLETELSNLRQSEQKGLLNIEQQRIAMPLITGQQAALQRQAQLERGDVLAQLESKQKALGFEFVKREGVMAKAKAALGFAETDLERIQKIEENQQKINQSILDYSLKLSDNAQQVFGAILKQFDGMGWDQLSPEAQAQLAQTATQAGVPTQVLAEAMNAQKDQKDIELKKQELEFEKMQGDIKQQQFSQELAVRKFEEDKRQFGLEYALKQQKTVTQPNIITDSQGNTFEFGTPEYIIERLKQTAGSKARPVASEREHLGKFANVVALTDNLMNSLSKTTNDPIIGYLRSLNPYDFDARAVNAQVIALVPSVARGLYGEVGVLTDTDIERYLKTLPNIKSTAQQNKFIAMMTLANAKRAYEQTLLNLASSNVNVSGFADSYTNLTNKLSGLEKELSIGDISVSSEDEAIFDEVVGTKKTGNYFNNLWNALLGR